MDPDHKNWELSSSISNWFTNYKVARFSKGDYAYINCAWCRVEILHAANIPLQDNMISETTPFKTGLTNAKTKDYRPHYMHGDKE